MPGHEAELKNARARYARELARESGSDDPRLEQAFAEVPREDFVGPPPWRLFDPGNFSEIRTSDPIELYRDALVALDAAKGINNGEPVLHAAWIDAVCPQPGETVSHVGAGTGYYTAILARLVQPGGMVAAYEIEPDLARKARRNLAACDGVTVVAGDAVALSLPPSDVIYVNAGVASPPLQWLETLEPEGRMVFPWRPSEEVALAVRITRAATGFEVKPLMPSWFIPCVGAAGVAGAARLPNRRDARNTRSAWLARDRSPDETATAIFGDVWFSSAPVHDA